MQCISCSHMLEWVSDIEESQLAMHFLRRRSVCIVTSPRFAFEANSGSHEAGRCVCSEYNVAPLFALPSSQAGFNRLFLSTVFSRSITFHLTASQLQFPTSNARFSGCRQRITRHDLPESGISTAETSIHDDHGDITNVEVAFSCQ